MVALEGRVDQHKVASDVFDEIILGYGESGQGSQ